MARRAALRWHNAGNRTKPACAPRHYRQDARRVRAASAWHLRLLRRARTFCRLPPRLARTTRTSSSVRGRCCARRGAIPPLTTCCAPLTRPLLPHLLPIFLTCRARHGTWTWRPPPVPFLPACHAHLLTRHCAHIALRKWTGAPRTAPPIHTAETPVPHCRATPLPCSHALVPFAYHLFGASAPPHRHRTAPPTYMRTLTRAHRLAFSRIITSLRGDNRLRCVAPCLLHLSLRAHRSRLLRDLILPALRPPAARTPGIVVAHSADAQQSTSS